jgi:hypothetical protein
MKYGLVIMLMLSAAAGHAQSWSSVLRDGPKKDAAFNKVMSEILLSGTMESYHYLDTTWDVSLKLPGAREAKLSKGNGSIILTVTFSFTTVSGIDDLLQKVKASLPDDYVYNLDYDPASHTYDYTFEINPMSKIRHTGYPNYFHLTGDTENVFLIMGRSPSWLISPR